MSLRLVVIALLLSVPALAAPRAASVVSWLCEGPPPPGGNFRITGSGFPFRDGAKGYVLTSSFVVFDEGRGFCHGVGDGVTERRAQLVRSDWGHGLALLAVDGAVPPEWPQLAELSFPASKDTPVTLTGYRDGVFQELAARVVQAPSTRHSIPFVDKTIEVQGAAMDAALVGSPAYAPGSSRVLGIVSHQYLQLVPGGTSRLREWDRKTGHREPHIVVIPALAARAWTEKLLAGTAPAPAFWQEHDAKLAARDVVTAGPLRLEAHCPPETPGGSGGPIGGSDGAGIGGESVTVPPCTALASLAPAVTTTWAYPGREPWLRALTASLAKRPHRILFFARRDPASRRWLRTPFYSLSQLYRLLGDPGLEPVTAPEAAPPGADPLLTRQWQHGRAAMAGAEAIYKTWDFPAHRELLRRVYLAAELLTSDEWRRVEPGDVDRVLAPQGGLAKVWDELEFLDGARAEALRAHLREIRETRTRLEGT